MSCIFTHVFISDLHSILVIQVISFTPDFIFLLKVVIPSPVPLVCACHEHPGTLSHSGFHLFVCSHELTSIPIHFNGYPFLNPHSCVHRHSLPSRPLSFIYMLLLHDGSPCIQTCHPLIHSLQRTSSILTASIFCWNSATQLPLKWFANVFPWYPRSIIQIH